MSKEIGYSPEEKFSKLRLEKFSRIPNLVVDNLLPKLGNTEMELLADMFSPRVRQ